MDMEYRRYENIISAAVVLLSIFSGLLIQLLIYHIFDVRIKDVPIILIAALWIGFSAVTAHIVNELEI
jgi:F0F1-type ATP synthase assembly protein I